ncbi:MAG TPA: zinc ribbon domain-containing protein [Candidatus Acidoferrales bacterium]|nr:zinc ribbon domain-containing protein [Candidatus Acidoferrales bacterium]
MDEKRFCRFCREHLFEGAEFCTNCGTIVTKPPTQPAEPNVLWSDVKSLWTRFWAKRATRQLYKITAGAAVGILILMFFAAGASATSTVSQNTAVQSSPLSTTEALTKAIAAPTDTPVDYSAQISAKYKVPFYKTTVNGREAYVGDVANETNKSIVVHIVIYPAKSLEDATNYKVQLIQSYKAQGYTLHKITDDFWFALLGKNVHLIGAMSTEWGFPATLDEGSTVG